MEITHAVLNRTRRNRHAWACERPVLRRAKLRGVVSRCSMASRENIMSAMRNSRVSVSITRSRVVERVSSFVLFPHTGIHGRPRTHIWLNYHFIAAVDLYRIAEIIKLTIEIPSSPAFSKAIPVVSIRHPQKPSAPASQASWRFRNLVKR